MINLKIILFVFVTGMAMALAAEDYPLLAVFITLFIIVDLLFMPVNQRGSQGSWKFEVSGNLPEEDIARIVEVIEKASQIDRRIVCIRQTAESTIEVMTGEQDGPLDGGGNIIYMENQNGRWRIVNSASWAS